MLNAFWVVNVVPSDFIPILVPIVAQLALDCGPLMQLRVEPLEFVPSVKSLKLRIILC